MSFLHSPLLSMADWVTQQSSKKRVYTLKEGTSLDVTILGHKGVSLCEISRLGLPVPQGIIITSDASLECHEAGNLLHDDLVKEYKTAILDLEKQTGQYYGALDRPPLLLAIRPGSSVSSKDDLISSSCDYHIPVPESWKVPGITKSFLNIGMNEAIMNHLAKTVGARFALDTYMRFLMNFGTLVHKINPAEYTDLIKEVSSNRGGYLSISDLQFIIGKFKLMAVIPDDPWDQVNYTFSYFLNHSHLTIR